MDTMLDIGKNTVPEKKHTYPNPGTYKPAPFYRCP